MGSRVHISDLSGCFCCSPRLFISAIYPAVHPECSCRRALVWGWVLGRLSISTVAAEGYAAGLTSEFVFNWLLIW